MKSRVTNLLILTSSGSQLVCFSKHLQRSRWCLISERDWAVSSIYIPGVRTSAYERSLTYLRSEANMADIDVQNLQQFSYHFSDSIADEVISS
jgi:hypothetical protein